MRHILFCSRGDSPQQKKDIWRMRFNAYARTQKNQFQIV